MSHDKFSLSLAAGNFKKCFSTDVHIPNHIFVLLSTFCQSNLWTKKSVYNAHKHIDTVDGIGMELHLSFWTAPGRYESNETPSLIQFYNIIVSIEGIKHLFFSQRQWFLGALLRERSICCVQLKQGYSEKNPKYSMNLQN